MILAFTGAGISQASGLPTFQEQGDLRECLSRSYQASHPVEFEEIISNMKQVCDNALPNEAHIVLADFDIPVITMNVDGLHKRAGTKHLLEIHGSLPDVVLYGDPAPRYADAHDWVFKLRRDDVFLIIGTSYYTNISEQLKICAMSCGAKIVEINDCAEIKVPDYIFNNINKMGFFEEFLRREYEI